MATIKWTNQAFLVLGNIYDYISKDSKKYAHLQTQRIKERTKILKTYPFTGKIVPETNIEEIRELIESNYRIIYRIKTDHQIEILSIFHSARMLRPEKL